jgi:hypothetical protein
MAKGGRNHSPAPTLEAEQLKRPANAFSPELVEVLTSADRRCILRMQQIQTALPMLAKLGRLANPA